MKYFNPPFLSSWTSSNPAQQYHSLPNELAPCCFIIINNFWCFFTFVSISVFGLHVCRLCLTILILMSIYPIFKYIYMYLVSNLKFICHQSMLCVEPIILLQSCPNHNLVKSQTWRNRQNYLQHSNILLQTTPPYNPSVFNVHLSSEQWIHFVYVGTLTGIAKSTSKCQLSSSAAHHSS